MSTSFVTQKHKIHLARQILESVSESANTAYYLFVGNHVPRTSATIPDITADANTAHFDPYSNMQIAKRATANDVSLIIRNIPYVANVVYDMYDHDEDLSNADYYVIVNASAYFHCYKCLDNNRGAESTVEPNFAHVHGSNSHLYQTSDGYRWKYMFTVDANKKEKFSTSDWFPFEANATVTSQATTGAIDVIKVDGTGAGYNNYLAGTFQSAHVRVGGNPLVYQVANDSIQQTNGYYTGCIMYLATGTGAGEYANVTQYYANSTGCYVLLDQAFSNTPTNGTTWQLNPAVQVTGFGTSVSNAVARALVNASASNSIYRVEMLHRGEGYQRATAVAIANDAVSVSSEADLRPILAPFGGHGYDAAAELGCSGVMFSVKFQNTESNTITSSNFFQQVGVIKDPLFANVSFTISSQNGTFVTNETVHKINPKQCKIDATINTTSVVLTAANADFENQFAVGDFVYLKASNGTNHMLTTISGVTNSTSINLASNGYFACTETIVYFANVTANAVFKQQANSTTIVTSNVQGTFTTSDVFVGMSSGAKVVISSVSRSGVTKDFSTFIQMPKFIGTVSSGTFLENEVVYQGNSLSDATATARLHTANVDGGTLTIYITNQSGTFTTGSLIGASSLAVASISTIYSPEISDGSGDVLYLENISPVTRQNNQTETVRVNFNF